MMNNDVMPSVIQMDEKSLKALLTEVKETVAVDFKMPAAKKSFGVNDLWKIRREAKTAVNRIK